MDTLLSIQADDSDDYKSIFEESFGRAVKFERILIDHSKMLKEKSEKIRYYYETFFTYDITTFVKSKKEFQDKNGVDEFTEDLLEYNHLLFSFMLINLLEFLMYGIFEHMKNIVENPLKEDINLALRQSNLMRFLNKSNKTIVKFNQLFLNDVDTVYKQLHKFILG